MKVPLVVDVPTPTVNITLPTNTPLMCSTEEAVKLFGVGKTTLNALRKTHSDFPVRTIGRSVWYLIPDMYAWFRDYPGGNIPVE